MPSHHYEHIQSQHYECDENCSPNFTKICIGAVSDIAEHSF
jgi:hypothetical protein